MAPRTDGALRTHGGSVALKTAKVGTGNQKIWRGSREAL
jgi:hypothetical protein